MRDGVAMVGLDAERLVLLTMFDPAFEVLPLRGILLQEVPKQLG